VAVAEHDFSAFGSAQNFVTSHSDLFLIILKVKTVRNVILQKMIGAKFTLVTF
jgi:hypothetical protein